MTRSPASISITATGLIPTSDSKYCFWRAISANNRAFTIATPTFAASVASSRVSASPYRPSSRVLWTLITPIARSPAQIGTPRYDFAGVPTTGRSSAVAVLCRSGSPDSMICEVRPSPNGIGGSTTCSPSSQL